MIKFTGALFLQNIQDLPAPPCSMVPAMRTPHYLLVAMAVTFIGVACGSQQPAAPKTDAAAEATAYAPTATIKDVMDSMVDPSADYLWESVATVVTKAAIEERR